MKQVTKKDAAAKKAVKKQTQPKMQYRELGEVAVDSGGLILTDPAYLQHVDGTQLYHELIERGVHVDEPMATGGILSGARLSNSWGKKFLGLNISGFGGDGVFPVLGIYGQGIFSPDTLLGILIDFRENRWESFKDERITQQEWEQLTQQGLDQPPRVQVRQLKDGGLFVGLWIRGRMIAADSDATEEQATRYTEAIKAAKSDNEAAAAFAKLHPSFTVEELQKRVAALPEKAAAAA